MSDFDRMVIDRYLDLAGICHKFAPRKSGYCATCQGSAGDHFLRGCLDEIDRLDDAKTELLHQLYNLQADLAETEGR